MTYEYTAYVSSERVNSGNEVLRVTAEGEFIWHENADEMIESGDYSQYPALRHILKALREAERIKAENASLVAAEKKQQMIRDGWRQCAEGQRTTQYCRLLDAAVKAEREACAKLCDELRDEDGFEPYGTECAAAIRARGE